MSRGRLPLGAFYPRYRKLRKAVVEALVLSGLLPLVAFRSRRHRGPMASPPRRILFVTLLKIGDTLTSLPSVGALRRRFPRSQLAIWIRSDSAPLFQLRQTCAVDAVFTGFCLGTLRAIRRFRADLALVASFVPQHLLAARLAGARHLAGYDYRGRGRAVEIPVAAPRQVGLAVPEYPPDLRILHQTEVAHLLARALGAPEPEPLRLLPDPGERSRVAHLAGLDEASGTGGPRVALHPWNGQRHYRWPLGRWASLGQRLVDERGTRIWITGGPEDAAEAGRLAGLIGRPGAVRVAAGRLSLDETAALFSYLDLLVAVDTMATHLAAAMGIPVLALFGPGAPKVWRPLGERHAVLQNTQSCHGCRQPRCFRERHECMEGIAVGEVFQTALGLLE